MSEQTQQQPYRVLKPYLESMGYAQFINKFGKEEENDIHHWHTIYQLEPANKQIEFIKAIIKRDNLNMELLDSNDFFMLFFISE